MWTQLAALALDAGLSAAIVERVSYTEIDYTTYIQQASLFLKGQTNYALISGDSGPLVYPAGHVYFYALLAHLGLDIHDAQYVFVGIYLSTLVVCMVLYSRCQLPSWVCLVLPLSKRLHSIYMLRLFNDGIAMLPMYGCILASTYQSWSIASLLFSLALSVKMNILLFLPALLLVSALSSGLWTTLKCCNIIVLSQVALSLPFTLHDKDAYLSSAFEFSRAFLYEWTVNWRFVPERIFVSGLFSSALLILHLVMLLVFLRKWLSPHGGITRVAIRAIGSPKRPATLLKALLTPQYITHIYFTTNLVGVLCARSLHYQFYSWYAFQLPFLVWQTELPLVLKFMLPLAVEVCWNVFPSTNISSLSLLAAHIALLLGAYSSDMANAQKQDYRIYKQTKEN